MVVTIKLVNSLFELTEPYIRDIVEQKEAGRWNKKNSKYQNQTNPEIYLFKEKWKVKT